MTLEFLEGTIFDLGPEFWAIMVLVVLIVIEMLDLGPCQFSSLFGAGKRKGRKTKMGGARRLHRHAPVDKASFKKIIQRIDFGEEDHALLYLGGTGGKMDLRPPPSREAKTGIFPQSKDFDNYVIAHGKESESTVLKQLHTLWSVKDRFRGVDHIVLYMSHEPSTYDVQCIAAMFQSYTSAARHVSVLYREGEGEGEVEGELEEKVEHFSKAGIDLDKIE